MENKPHQILDQHISCLGFGKSLELMLQMNHISNLKQLLNIHFEKWNSFNGFIQHLLNQLMNYLDRMKLMPVVKD